jgi:hypothetical protein
LSVVCGEGNGENVVGVSNKSTSSGTSGKLPKSESLVPRGREGVCTVRGNNLKKLSQQESQDKYAVFDGASDLAEPGE